MKLRNKKTGEISELAQIRQYWREEKDGGVGYLLQLHDAMGDGFIYNSLAELNEEWEDYTPTKPLIKDEAKRSVFKAWAEILGRDLEKADFKYDAERNSFNCYIADSTIEFANGEGINCVDREIYTFRALCGEEEE